MILIPSKKLVILLPWKTASQTLRVRLSNLNKSPYPFLHHFNPFLNRVIHQHLILSDFLALPEAAEGYRLAVFVRNPYDRVYSGFQQILRDALSQPKWRYTDPWVHDLIKQQVSENFADICQAEFNVDQWFMQLAPHKIFEAGRNSNLCLHPCHYWTHRQGAPLADFIGRVENFEEDFQQLCDKYDLEPASHETVNQSPDFTGETDQRGYKYPLKFEAQTVSRINELFATDFHLFGYEMITPNPN